MELVLLILLNFYWSLVDLLFVSFKCTAKWISFAYSYIYSFLDFFSPIKAVTHYWAEFPVLYNRSLLVIYFIYSSVYMLIPVSQFIPAPSLSPGNHKLVFYVLILFLFEV